MKNKLQNDVVGVLADSIELFHQLMLWDPTMEQSEELVLQLFKIWEFLRVVLQIPLRHLPVQG